MSDSKINQNLRIILLGYIVRGPLGGLAWHHLQYVMGLRDLGYDVYFVEDSNDYASCYNPTTHSTDRDPSYGLRFAEQTFSSVRLGDRWAYYDAHTEQWHGPCANRILDLFKSADLLLNISGVNPLRPWLLDIPKRAFIDTDPVFTQLRHLTDATAQNLAYQHTSFFSFGENINAGCGDVPDDHFPWKATRQPIVLKSWPVTPGPSKAKFTTVMQWDSYPPRDHEGKTYGMKSASFEDYFNLPSSTGNILEIALGSPSAPRAMLEENGWYLRDPLKVTISPWSYQTYIQQSKAEFSVAKQAYVISRSGWFSERSACYLASGRPVVSQETGFSEWLKTGEGILSFKTQEEACAMIEEVNHRYDFHCKAAREIAEEYFDSNDVLTTLVEDVMASDNAYSRSR
jgi:hypothetical protein